MSSSSSYYDSFFKVFHSKFHLVVWILNEWGDIERKLLLFYIICMDFVFSIRVRIGHRHGISASNKFHVCEYNDLCKLRNELMNLWFGLMDEFLSWADRNERDTHEWNSKRKTYTRGQKGSVALLRACYSHSFLALILSLSLYRNLSLSFALFCPLWLSFLCKLLQFTNFAWLTLSRRIRCDQYRKHTLI